MAKSFFPKVTQSVDVRREHIARAAAQLIASDGLEGLTMRAIASTSGCSRGLVEHYFQNKEDLVNAADAWANSQTVNRASRAIKNKQGLNALEIRLRHILPFTNTILNEWRVRVVFWRKISLTAKQAAGETIPFEPIFTALLHDIESAQRNGEIPADLNVPLMTEFVLFNVTGIACLCLSDTRLRNKMSLEERVQMILSMLRSGNLAAVQFSKPGVY